MPSLQSTPSIIVIALSVAVVAAAMPAASQGQFVSRAAARKKLSLLAGSTPHAPAASGLISCPCEDVSLCAPLTTPLPDKESFAFQVDATNWPFYDWSRLTSIVLYDGLDPAMLCMAHARGVRLIWAATFSASDLLNDTAKAAFIDNTVTNVVNTYTDGVNFDFEGLVNEESPQEGALTQLTSDLSHRLKAAVPTSSMSFDVAWSAQHVDVRYYNYTALAAICDYLVIMDYDTRSQVFSGPPCYAGPNSPINTAVDGIKSFLDLPNVQPRQLILGEPWYGYVYPCMYATEVTEEACAIQSVPFRGVPCSDAAGQQWNFGYIQQYLRNASTQRLTPLIVNTSDAAGGSYAHVTVNGSLLFPPSSFTALPIAGIYFDDPKTLHQKFRVAKQWGLRGVSMWNMDSVSFDPNDAEETKAMWESLDGFLR